MASERSFLCQHLSRFRGYLRVLAAVQLGPRLQAKLDPSDVVQLTLLEAFQKREQFQGATEKELAAWLRTMLTRNLADVLRAFGQEKRDVRRERSLNTAMSASSARLEQWFASSVPSPEAQAVEQERALLLAEVLAQLPEPQREALVLHYWHEWPLARIAQHIGRTPAAVAGLLKRGLRKLREEIQDGESSPTDGSVEPQSKRRPCR